MAGAVHIETRTAPRRTVVRPAANGKAAPAGTDSDRGSPQPPADTVSRDARDNLTTIATDYGSARFRYDAEDRLVAAHRPGLAPVRFGYDAAGRLAEVRRAEATRRYRYDDAGRIARIERGDAGAAVFRHDAAGRIVLARTSRIGLSVGRDASGAIRRLDQTIDGITLAAQFVRRKLEGAREGVLSHIVLSGLGAPIRYEWDDEARPSRILLGNREIVRYDYPCPLTCRLRFANGWSETAVRQEQGCLPTAWTLSEGDQPRIVRRYQRDTEERIVSDGARSYAYDYEGRLAEERTKAAAMRHRYDAEGNRAQIEGREGSETYLYRADGSLMERRLPDGSREHWSTDGHGRTTQIDHSTIATRFRYDDADQLVRAEARGASPFEILSDAFDRTTLLGDERHLYGPDNQLLAVYDRAGALLRAYVHGPNGRVLAEIRTDGEDVHIRALHLDPMGHCRAVSSEDGGLLAEIDYTAFGVPALTGDDTVRPIYQNHFWCPALGLYDFGARWYAPGAARFLTPDSHTGAPDDARLLHAPPRRLARTAMRAALLDEWMREPATRLRYAFCWYEPVNHHDPDGHWPAGAVAFNIFGFLWTLPNTLLGLFFEITCLVGEILRLILWLFSGGRSLWEPLGVEAASSDRVHAWAIVFRGGWLGSLPGLMGLTFGNVFFVHGKWEDTADLGGPGEVFPEQHGGTIVLSRQEAFYEHMLTHTLQSYRWGPLFWFIPPPGIYLWSIIVSGKCGSFLEREAKRRAGL